LNAVLGVLLLSCGGSDRPAGGPGGDRQEPAAVASMEEDAAALGREIYDLVDRAMAYRSSHRYRLPRNLRELGIDDLTPATSRSLTVSGTTPTVTVSFRSSAGHTLSSCRGTSAVLEEAALGGGSFSVICTLVAGGTATLTAQR
jgi:hypothetical protein